MRRFYIVLILWSSISFVSYAAGLITNLRSESSSVYKSELNTYLNSVNEAAPNKQGEAINPNLGYSTVCMTSYGSCPLPKQALTNSPCYCQSSNGLVYGIAK